MSAHKDKHEALISVIIPFYQVEAYIAECLESVIGQTLPDIEIICVDDGGTDRSLEIVREFAARDSRISIISNHGNKGQAFSRNAGIEHSTAPCLMFLDSDDTYAPTMCEKMYGALSASGADLAMCGIMVSYEADSSLKKSDSRYFALRLEGTHPVDDNLIASCDGSVCNKIFRRQQAEEYGVSFPDGMKYEDVYFVKAYLVHARTITRVGEKLYHYRRRSGSTMNQTFTRTTSMSRDHLHIALLLHEHYCRWGLMGEKYGLFCRLFLTCVDNALRHAPSEQVQDDILCQAGDFVRKHMRNTTQLDGETARRLNLLCCAFRTQSWGGIIRIETKPFSKRYSFLGLPLYRIQYAPSSRKHYVLGFKLFSKKYESS